MVPTKKHRKVNRKWFFCCIYKHPSGYLKNNYVLRIVWGSQRFRALIIFDENKEKIILRDVDIIVTLLERAKIERGIKAHLADIKATCSIYELTNQSFFVPPLE